MIVKIKIQSLGDTESDLFLWAGEDDTKAYISVGEDKEVVQITIDELHKALRILSTI